MLICCAVTVQLICAFVFAYAKNRFSHDVAHIAWACYCLMQGQEKEVRVSGEGSLKMNLEMD